MVASSLFSRMTVCAELYRVFAPADDAGGLALGSEPAMQTWYKIQSEFPISLHLFIVRKF